MAISLIKDGRFNLSNTIFIGDGSARKDHEIQEIVRDIAAMTDRELYERLMNEFLAWLAAARGKGIVP